MRAYLLLIFVIFLTSCGHQLKDKAHALHSADSTAMGQWRPPSNDVKDVTIYKKDGKVFLHENFIDESTLNEEMVVETTNNVVTLKYKEIIADQYIIIDKDGSLKWFTPDGREYAKSRPK
jgi:outer membrane lipopolysaccharide assembly protein LptE/RlpB